MRMRKNTFTFLLCLSISAVGCADEASDADDAAESSSASAFTEGTVLVTTAPVNLRTGPSTNASVLAVLATGTKVTTTSTASQGSWRHVRSTGGTGWVHESNVRVEAVDGGSDAPQSPTGVSARGQDQMSRLVSHADRNHSGASRGRCFEYVWRYLSSSGYGNIDEYGDAADMPSAYARNFAEYMNKPANAQRWGLQRLPLSNPYDAPRGAVVVVAAGSPGTAHPTAGDISVAAGNGRFINDGPNMGYGGSAAAFTRGGGRVLGIFVPR